MLLTDHDERMSNLLKRPFFQSSKHLVLLCVVGAVILLVATASFFQLKDQYNTRLQSDFQGRLGAVHQSMVTWSKERKSFIASWVNQPELMRISLPIVRNDNETSTKLARYNLDDFLRPVMSDPSIKSYYLVGAGNQILASNELASIGQVTSLAVDKVALEKAWQGASVVTAPRFISKNRNQLQQFVAAGIRVGQERPLAVLIFELIPQEGFLELLAKASFGRTGESYIFNNDALMLSPNRVGEVRVYLRTHFEPESSDIQPLTLLAHEALAYRPGIQVRESYVGYQGEPVIGAWLWDSQLNIGLAVEQSAREGKQFIDQLRAVFVAFTCVVFLLFVTFFSLIAYHSSVRSRQDRQARTELTQRLEELHRDKTQEVEEREARYRAIIDTAWDAIFAVDSNGVIQSLNPAVGRIFGRGAQDYLGIPLSDILKVKDVDGEKGGMLSRHYGQSFEAIGVRCDGSFFPVAVSSSRTTSGKNSFYTVVLRDISKQKKNEQEIRAIQHRLELSQAFAHIGTWEWSLQTDQILATDMALSLLGISVDSGQVSMAFFFNHLVEEDSFALRQEMNEAIASNRSFSCECRLIVNEQAETGDGGEKQAEWLLIQGTPILDNEVTKRIIGHIQKITEQKTSAAELENARNMLSLVLDTIPSGVYWKDSSLKIAGLNTRFAKDIGLPAEQIIGKSDHEIYHNRKQAALISSLDQWVLETQKAKLSENGLYHMNDGRDRHIEISRLPIKNSAQNPIGVLGVYSDVTERIEAQENLRKHHRLLASIYSTQLRYFSHASKAEIFRSLLDEIIAVTDSEYGFIGEVRYTPSGQIFLRTFAITDISWSEETQKLYQDRAEEGFEFFNLDTLFGYTLKTAETVISNQPDQDPRAGGLPHGHPSLKAYLGTPLMKGDELIGMIGLANRAGGYQDELVDFLRPMLTTCSNLITALQNDAAIELAQHQLLSAKNAAEKASQAKTEFLSRMSHELRTPMNAILGFTRLLEDQVANNDEASEFVSEIDKAGQHLMSLINEVLDLERIESGRIELDITTVDLVQLIDECCKVIEPVARRYGIKLVNGVDATAHVAVKADEVRLRQVLLNLISNGIKYNRPEGQVEIAIELLDDQCHLHVSDTGVGINQQQQAHLFESFNRLHAEGSDIEGTGMGLVISKRLTEMMQGQLDFSSQEGVGSRFSIALSLVDGTSLLSEKAVGYLEGNAANIKRVLFAAKEASVGECCPELEPELVAQDVYFVNSAMSFLEHALQNSYQLLVLDEKIDDIPLEELVSYLAEADVLEQTNLVVLSKSSWLKDTLDHDAIKLHIHGKHVGPLIADALSES